MSDVGTEILYTVKHSVEYKEKDLQGLVHVWSMTLEQLSATSLLSECTKRFTYEELLSKPKHEKQI
jgi:hypothetical protein